jgi:hypothetical protein
VRVSSRPLFDHHNKFELILPSVDSPNIMG